MDTKRTLFVGDLHGCHTVAIEQLIDELEPDLTVFLGDYFDHFDDTPETAARMARWLADSIEHDNRIHLIGNHDLPYMTSGSVGCPGYTPQKAAFIAHEIDLARWRERSRIFHWVTPALLASHAGLSLTFLEENLVEPKFLANWLQAEEVRAWNNLDDQDRPRIHPLWRVGQARSQGWGRGCGGLLWCDWDDEFVPVPGIGQIVGHTPSRGIRLKSGRYSTVNICVDTCDPRGGGPRQCLLWQHGQYEIISLPTRERAKAHNPKMSGHPIRNLLARHREDILRLAAENKIENVRLFGAVARCEEHINSDVDLLVDTLPNATLFDLGGFEEALKDLLGVKVDISTTGGLSGRLRERVLKEAVPL